MTNYIELSEKAFAALFKPIKNHLNPDASFDWGDGFGTIFETYDSELEFVSKQEPAKIWTLLSGDDGDFIASGFHFVNRLGYFVTENAPPSDIHVHVVMEDVISPERCDLSTTGLLESLQCVVEQFWSDEERDYLATNKADRKLHVFHSLSVIRNWMEAQRQTTMGGSQL
jgi:hypothetical protein